MVICTSQLSTFLLLFLLVATFYKSVSSDHGVRCNEKDRKTLLKFRQGVIDPHGLLSSWSNEEDCCAWNKVQCDNITGRVTNLDLQGQYLQGELNLCLLELEFLNSLDVSFNHFDVISIPSIQDNVTLGSNLSYLDLSHSGDHLYMDSLKRLSQLFSLKYLGLNGIDLHKENDWLQLVAMLPLLSKLYMNQCNLNTFGPTLKYVNFTSLVALGLSSNNFNSELPSWLFNISNDHISFLDLSHSKIHGEIPSSLSNLWNLKTLYLSSNQLKGSIPNWIGKLEHLQLLDLSYNMFHGYIPLTLGNLSSLESLYIRSNSFSNAISEIYFSKLYNLKHLDLSNSTLSFHFDPKWIPPFQLNTLSLANTNQGPNLLPWIYTQKSLEQLDISKSGISFIKNEFWSIVSGIDTLAMSSNSISGDISNVTFNSTRIYFDHNNFTGGLPNLLPKFFFMIIDFSYNSFSGSIPHGWANLQSLWAIDLWGNKLSGEVPADFSNLMQLGFLNLGKNEFSRNIPNITSQKLQVMVLRFNRFEGNIPPQIFNLSSLYHLDLAHNKLSGSMPHCIYNMTQMIIYYIRPVDAIAGRVQLFTKGQDYEPNLYSLRRTFDLSDNNLSGEIPAELFRLVQIQTLNLSHNHLTGAVHTKIGGMKNMESLDLSNNKLTGEIPQSMADLSFLGYLNLSNNNFIGRIPIGTQLQSFDASSYSGNPKLCGDPLKNCTTKENPKNPKQDAETLDDDSGKDSLYLGMGVGFALGFWVTCGSLLLIRKWRHTYYRFLDHLADQLYVTFLVKFNNFCKTKASGT